MNYSIRPLEPSYAEGAVRALSLAFRDDPLFVFIAPDHDQRRVWMLVVMRETLRSGAPEPRRRVAVTARGEVVGAMIAGSYPSPWRVRLRQQLLTLLLPRPWIPDLRYVFRVFRYLHDWDARHYRRPHHYVYVIGVDPSHQHRGLGRRLMRPLLDQADAEELPVYLETVTESNLRFYEGLGFRQTDSCRSSPDGPRTWMLLREATAGVPEG